MSDEYKKGYEDGYKAGKRHQSKSELSKWVNLSDGKSRGSGEYKKGYDKGWNDSYK